MDRLELVSHKFFFESLRTWIEDYVPEETPGWAHYMALVETVLESTNKRLQIDPATLVKE